MGSSFTRDDGMVGAMYLHVQTEQAFGLAPSLPLQSVDEWRPMVSLRHMAQQIMIRNMAETPRGTPRTTHHLELHRASLSSSSSDSSLPGTPLWMDEEMHRDFSLVGDSLFREEASPSRQRAASFHSACQPIKRNIDSSLKAAKLLGIEALSGPIRPKPKTTQLVASSLRQLVDSKMRLFRRATSFQGGASLKAITKDSGAQLMDHVDMQRRMAGKSGFRQRKSWRKLFVVLSGSTLYCFQDKHTAATDELAICDSTVVCVSDSFAGQQFVLEVIDGPRSWFLRFDDKASLARWMAAIRDANKTRPPSAPLPTPPHTPRYRIHHRHTAPANTFLQTLEQVPEYA
ncbi:hypothetical protein DSO57_1010570 [Entomophthora muscae]|uniref:Uncharacterized protein n=1 Tax=Entomophthora muscae TaxID=34485 RepID=A0ACC2TH64_9FUNG|nr:hypothetical protein DSO57_1010570 [Entomophthora muscae]